MVEGYQRLTEKEKQTLRLLLIGHDAKSCARHFGLSVHTINERLRDARRKLAVSSSKEAARLLRQVEQPENVGDTVFGEAASAAPPHGTAAPDRPRRRRCGAAWALGGTAMLSIAAAALVLSAPLPTPPARDSAEAAAPVAATPASTAARRFLELVDDARWSESWAATARSFQTVNTVAGWQAASEKARGPLGRLVSRTLLSDDFTPAPPNGYRTVRFREDFLNKQGMIETVALHRDDDGAWKVAGIVID